MLLNGIELEFDFYEADQMEIFEDAIDRAGVEINKALEAKKQSQLIRGICQATINMLDEIFGEGTANEVFQGETNFKKSIEIFNALVKERIRQEEELNVVVDEMKELTDGRNIQQPNNRQIRRLNKKN